MLSSCCRAAYCSNASWTCAWTSTVACAAGDVYVDCEPKCDLTTVAQIPGGESIVNLCQQGARERQAVWMIPAPTFMLRASWQSKPHSSTPWMSNRCCSVPPSTRHGESNVAHGVLFRHEKVSRNTRAGKDTQRKNRELEVRCSPRAVRQIRAQPQPVARLPAAKPEAGSPNELEVGVLPAPAAHICAGARAGEAEHECASLAV